MITRVENGLTYNQTFDAENRLISVTVSSQTTQFIYDGDGNLVKKIKPDGSKTIYVGGIYEVDKNAGGSVTGTKTYYPAAGAMRVGSTLSYVLGDHLGSASVVTNTSGAIVGEDRFYPFGETRFTTGTMFTDKLFTGQREIADLGIYHYGARFYSPKLGRFLSADTIVPGYANPQSLNRFSYVINNPLRYTDPTGHMFDDGCRVNCGGSTDYEYDPPTNPNNDEDDEDDVTLDSPGDIVSGQITAGELDAIAEDLTSYLIGNGGLNDQADSNVETINIVNGVAGLIGGVVVCLNTAGIGCAIISGTVLFGEALAVDHVATEMNSTEEFEDAIQYFNDAANLANNPNEELIFIAESSSPGGDVHITITGMQESLVIEGGMGRGVDYYNDLIAPNLQGPFNNWDSGN